ncbi:Zinc finger BED domain-containing protein 4-like [Oopsacas minuta]|uniref:Zinc finger BED domain-containing protein 4-like n=1 Tax=Oopsacas minuta TaxID=111878 RepID=A0AAV7JUM0_9METZ|nr:Zinc finger BED domain-containing protein 4-like [Oopsacas minuta]
MKRHHPEVDINPEPGSPSDQSIMKFISVTSDTWSFKDPGRIDLTKSAVNFNACSLQSLSRVDDPNFRTLLHKAQPAYILPSRKHLTRLLPERTTQLHANNLTCLNAVDAICLTLDLWSSRDMRSYVGITGHFIEDFKLKSVMLACRRFKGPHTAENILLNYQQVTCSFNIERKITTIITDDAVNMIKALQLFLDLKKIT